jgi:hypothetical protein
MTNRFLQAALGLGLGLSIVAGCREGMGPGSSAAPTQLTGSLSTRTNRQSVLLRTNPLRTTQASAVIGSDGGTLRLADAGLTLSVPAGAVAADVEFTVTARAGRLVAYEFEPHGITFALPLTLTQELDGTRAARNVALMSTLAGGYFASSAALDSSSGTAEVRELLRATVDATSQTVSFPVAHFSGYILAVGRSDSTKTTTP